MRAVERLLIVVSVAASILGPTASWADDEGNATTGAYLDPQGDPTASASTVTYSTGGVSSSGGGSSCSWKVATVDGQPLTLYTADGNAMQGIGTNDTGGSYTGRWLYRTCDGQIVSGLVPERTAVDPAVLAAQARESIPIPDPVIGFSPSEGGETYAQLNTWLWVDEGWWQERTATASAGGVTATVTASPSQSSWTTGDGSTTTCTGPGVAWRPGMAEDATNCSHTYRRSSASEPNGSFTVTVAVGFNVTWTSNVGPGGTLAGVTRTASRPVRVGEIQALEVQ